MALVEESWFVSYLRSPTEQEQAGPITLSVLKDMFQAGTLTEHKEDFLVNQSQATEGKWMNMNSLTAYMAHLKTAAGPGPPPVLSVGGGGPAAPPVLTALPSRIISTKACPHCGYGMSASARFCSSCGGDYEAPPAASAGPVSLSPAQHSPAPAVQAKQPRGEAKKQGYDKLQKAASDDDDDEDAPEQGPVEGGCKPALWKVALSLGLLAYCGVFGLTASQIVCWQDFHGWDVFDNVQLFIHTDLSILFCFEGLFWFSTWGFFTVFICKLPPGACTAKRVCQCCWCDDTVWRFMAIAGLWFWGGFIGCMYAWIPAFDNHQCEFKDFQWVLLYAMCVMRGCILLWFVYRTFKEGCFCCPCCCKKEDKPKEGIRLA